MKQVLFSLALLGFFFQVFSQATRADELREFLFKPDEPGVLVAAHRGDWRNAPENSLDAIERAITMGVDIIEIDVRPTSDGHFVLMHDKTLDRTTSGTGLVKKLPLDSIQKLHLKNGYGVVTAQQVPTLEQALQLTRGRALIYIDKSDYYINEIVKIAENLGMLDQVLFYGYRTFEELQEFIGDNVNDILYIPRIKGSTKEIEAYVQEYEKCPVIMADFESTSSFSYIQIGEISEKQRVWCNPLWPSLCANHHDDVASKHPDQHWGWLIDQGASILCTDRPMELLQFLSNKNLRPKFNSNTK